ncbi:antitoxin Xre/MbcA/ParS toxin-binding domain-containing protein [Roseovarius sp. Pro17]|uniref:antitoxin Xre/MbcA/ParS toxin-binding domain-containing protein n=1 Tax=Roseovarius sp. Pro17 TaxID=3108175 RepID=UPI002D79C196|nr:antitoxin Xre/MbcA/ParS toxin-binding domain-containing protein [Roseovarius sp. Pro17]
MDRYADILEQAISVFGSRDAAEEWMNRPAIGLNRRRPIDLICTSGEAEVVETYLSRIDYGVYC